MKHIVYVITISVLTLAFWACQKEITSTVVSETTSKTKVGSRSDCDVFYAVSTAPTSQILTLDVNTYDLLGSTQLTGTIPGGGQVTIQDIKGIAFMLGDYYVTTGKGNDPYFENSLLKIDPTTGTVIQHVLNLGITVSDICFIDKNWGNQNRPYYGLVGLVDNSNELIWIQYWQGVFSVGMTSPIDVLYNDYVASGLTWVDADCGVRKLLVSTTSPKSNKCYVHWIEPIYGQHMNVEHVFVGTEFQGAHVANGWLVCLDEFQIGHKYGNDFSFSAYATCVTPWSPWANNAGYAGNIYPIELEDFCTRLTL